MNTNITQNLSDESRFILGAGAIITGIGVAFGAFGAHGLKSILNPASLAIYQTGVQYQLIHGLALVAIGSSQAAVQAVKLRLVSRLWVAGVVLFSGSLYALAITGIKILGAITPLGGVCFLSGWVILAVTALRKTG